MAKNTLILIVIALMLACCNRAKNAINATAEKATDNLRLGFYSDPGAWDYYRMPLIKPWQVEAIDDTTIWYLCKKDETTTTSNVVQVGVTDSIIYYSCKGNCYGAIDTRCDSVYELSDEASLRNTLKRLGIEHPKMMRIDSAYNQFAHKKITLFTPPSKWLLLEWCVNRLRFMKFWVKRALKNSFLKNYSKRRVFLIFYIYICNVIDDFLFLKSSTKISENQTWQHSVRN